MAPGGTSIRGTRSSMGSLRPLQTLSLQIQLLYSWTLEVKVKVKLLSHVQLFETSWTVAYQAPQSMEFSRQKY